MGCRFPALVQRGAPSQCLEVCHARPTPSWRRLPDPLATYQPLSGSQGVPTRALVWRCPQLEAAGNRLPESQEINRKGGTRQTKIRLKNATSFLTTTEDFDFEETLRDIHIELQGLNEEAAVLASQIQKNFEELGV